MIGFGAGLAVAVGTCALAYRYGAFELVAMIVSIAVASTVIRLVLR